MYPNREFSDGLKRLLRSRPALPAASTRERAAAFGACQADVCAKLAALGYPLGRMVAELKAGHLTYFREGSDQDRKRNNGKKSSYRFAGLTAGHVGEFDGKVAERRARRLSPEAFEAWQGKFLMRFTFEVIEQVAVRVAPAEPQVDGGNRLRAGLAQALAEARKLQEEILLGNLLLVAKAVLRRGRFLPGIVGDDLFSAGMDGLMIAVNRYDPSVGLFSTYAMPWITMAMDRFVAKTRSVIRVPIGVQDKARRRRAANEGEFSFEIPRVQSLEDPVPGFEDGDLRLEDVVADTHNARPTEAAEHADISRILSERLRKLDTLKQFVIAMRSDIGDAAALGARLFQEEAALSLARGRQTCAAAAKAIDDPARIRMIGGAAAIPASDEIRAAEAPDAEGKCSEFAVAV
jgi:RNA polymerase sigma factor (sigma-70 family)